jgi:hypothetical protein
MAYQANFESTTTRLVVFFHRDRRRSVFDGRQWYVHKPLAANPGISQWVKNRMNAA